MLHKMRLRQLRLASGYSLDALAHKMEGLVTKQAISKYETGKAQPTQAVLNKLASALGVKAATLTSEPKFEVNFHGFRKRAKLRARAAEEIQSKVAALLEQRITLQGFYKHHEPARVPFKSFPVRSTEEAETAANLLRDTWELGTAPISDVTNTLEEHLIHVLELKGTEHFDGLSATAVNESGEVVGGAVVSSFESSGERQRFNLAHELGHLVMNVVGNVNEEDTANRFASAFLAPRDTVLALTGVQRHHISLSELILLKQRLGMSIQAILYRLKDLSVISETLHRGWCIDINKQGWRKNEPEALPREEPRWFRRAILQAVTESWITKEEGESMLAERLDLDEPLSLADRKAFMKLPLEERRRIMAKQAEELAEHYNSDNEWREVEGGDIIE